MRVKVPGTPENGDENRDDGQLEGAGKLRIFKPSEKKYLKGELQTQGYKYYNRKVLLN